jgi:hypothetical protein
MQNKLTARQALTSILFRVALLGGLGLAASTFTGCSTASTSAMRYSPAAVAALSPAAEVVPTFEALSLAKKYVAANPGTDYLVGSGSSMLPLYKDHTVVVTRPLALADLKAGMTAVYLGDAGRPVAHVLVQRTSDGWVAQGVGNATCDATRVTADNLIGVVVKAYEPTRSPLAALVDEASAQSSVASLP